MRAFQVAADVACSSVELQTVLAEPICAAEGGERWLDAGRGKLENGDPVVTHELCSPMGFRIAVG